jgi:hypothetical protein
VRLITLTGPPGVGKTRLGLHLAMAMGAPGGAFPDRTWFVPLATLADPALVGPALARALGVRAAGGAPLRECLVARLRGRASLLVLDNFEQVMTAAPVLADLLAACAGLTLLVTSRAALRLAWEHEYPVPPLAVPPLDPLPPLPALAESPAVALFVTRARAARPGFALTEANAPAVAAICARLDGLPLALELAAAWTKLLPPAALLARLGDQTDLLTVGLRDAPVRHQTLRAALAVDDLLAGLGLAASDRLRWYREQIGTRDASGDEYRRRKDVLRSLLGDPDFLSRCPGGAEIAAALAARRPALAAVGQALAEPRARGALTRPPGSLYRSYVHMHCNRLLGGDAAAEGTTIALLARTRASLEHAPIAAPAPSRRPLRAP